ncbi:MAG: ORF6N domain-containing protein [Paludibacter sp.]
MTENLQLQPSIIQNKIYTIRNQKVMLDFDLAELYTVETKRLKEAVRRNISRFPNDFMFELNDDEWKILRTQFATSSWGGIRYAPYAFTEQGVAMLASVLKSETAIQVNIGIVRAFVAIRQSLISKPANELTQLQTEFSELRAYIEEVFTDYNDINEDTRIQMELINQSLAELHTDKILTSKPRKRIGFITEE